MSAAEPGHGLSNALRRRARLFRRARLAVIAFVVGYFFAPYGVRAWVPAWLPFLAALGLEVHFFLGGYLQARRGRELAQQQADRGPQPRDLSELGGDEWPDADASEEAGEPEAAGEEEPRHPYGRYLIETVAAVALVAGILLLASRPHGWSAVSATKRARAEVVFSREAARIAGHPARVSCDTSGEYVGFVQDADGLAFVGGEQAYVTPSICDALYQLAFKHRVRSFPLTARAIAVLAHESWHLQGVSNEGLANCYGFQSGVRIGVHLGLSESTARAMMREQLATNASDAGGDAQYLVPRGCRDGGADDLHRATSGFP